MSYCSQFDLVTRFGEPEIAQLSRGEDGEIDGLVVLKAINDASAEIDGLLASRYDVPIATPPENLRRIACDITRYQLYDHDVPEIVQTRYDQAIDYLRDVAMARANLPGIAEKVAASAGGDAEIQGPVRTFSRDSLKDF